MAGPKEPACCPDHQDVKILRLAGNPIAGFPRKPRANCRSRIWKARPGGLSAWGFAPNPSPVRSATVVFRGKGFRERWLTRYFFDASRRRGPGEISFGPGGGHTDPGLSGIPDEKLEQDFFVKPEKVRSSVSTSGSCGATYQENGSPDGCSLFRALSVRAHERSSSGASTSRNTPQSWQSMSVNALLLTWSKSRAPWSPERLSKSSR